MKSQSAQDKRITDELAARVLGWQATPDRFLKANRGWIPRWRFAPLARLDDAFVLLEAASGHYKLELAENTPFTAEVAIGHTTGTARGECKPRVITIAVARALGLEGCE
jgi:hypothetical protein